MIQTLEGFNRNKTVTIKQIYSDNLINLKKYSGTATLLGPGIGPNGLPVTGLTENFVDAKGKEVEGTRRTLEKELDMEEGSLKAGKAFWVTHNLRIGADPVPLNLWEPLDMLNYLMACAQSIVAIGIKERDNKSGVEFVISSDEEEAVERVVGRRSLKEAYQLTEKLDKETKINILAVKGIIADATTPGVIDDKIDNLAETDPDGFIRLVQDGNLVYRALISKALDKAILTMDKGQVMHGEIVMGFDKESAADALVKDPKLAAIIKAKLSGDMDILRDVLKEKKEVIK